MPPPPHVWTPEQRPQLLTLLGLPHRSVPLTPPQEARSREQNAQSLSVLLQEHTPELHVLLPEHVPQLAIVRVVPHRSIAVRRPQLAPFSVHSSASLSAVQVHWFASHTAAPLQAPQSTVRGCPHLSTPLRDPHAAPSRAQNAASASATQAQ